MTLRLFLILTLLVQQLALPAVALGSVTGLTRECVGCVDSSCCRIVETTSCCGETLREMRCGRTGGRECVCNLGPGGPDPAPDAPRPNDRHEITPLVPAPAGSVIDVPTPARSLFAPASPAIVRTHNETQALLCIWRT